MDPEHYDIRDGGCTCFISAPCSFCMTHSECQSCGELFIDDDQENNPDCFCGKCREVKAQ